MIEIALQLIAMDDWIGVSENIEIAKGKYEKKDTFAKGFKQLKRNIGWQRK
jgi:hypothetical protein